MPYSSQDKGFLKDVRLINNYPITKMLSLVYQGIIFCGYFSLFVIEAEPISDLIHLESESNWIGPVARTSSKGNVLQLYLNVTIPLEKCCPGIMILTEPIDGDLIKEGCYDVGSNNLKALYTLTSEYIGLDWNLYDNDVDCTVIYQEGTYNCTDKSEFGIEMELSTYNDAELFLFNPCGRQVGFNMSYEISLIAYNKSFDCIELDSNLSPCTRYYPSAFLPNPLGMISTNVKDAEGGVLALTELAQECHAYFQEFACRLLLPECTLEGVLLPCQSFCEEVLLDACSGQLRTYIEKIVLTLV